MNRINIRVEEGFIVHWTKGFMESYGSESEFPKALSDLYTLKIARLMDQKGDLAPETQIALFSNEAAVEEIKNLIRSSETAGSVLYKEAFGTAPLGSIESVIDKEYCAGTFGNWLQAFEDKDYALCKDLLKVPH